MKSPQYQFTLLALATAALAACQVSPSPDESASAHASVLVSVAGLSDACPNGGVLLDYGIDTNGDGLLGPSEVTDTYEICHGEDGANGQPCTSAPQDDGSYLIECPGSEPITISSGVDGEAGESGPVGSAGEHGVNSLVITEALADGDGACMFGGLRITTGLDFDGDGLISADEVQSIEFICHGEPHVCAGVEPLAITELVTGNSEHATSVASFFTFDVSGGRESYDVDIVGLGQFEVSSSPLGVYFTPSYGGWQRFTVVVSDGCTLAIRDTEVWVVGDTSSQEDDESQDLSLCTHVGFTQGDATATLGTYPSNYWIYDSPSADGEQSLQIRGLTFAGGPAEPGIYILSENSPNDSNLQVIASSGCSDGSCSKHYFATSGAVEITTLGEAGEVVSGVLRDVVLNEYYPSQGTLAPEGTRWCMPEVSFSATFPALPSVEEPEMSLPEVEETSCLPDGNGRFIGHNIADTTLQLCNGETETLHSLGCNESTKAVWLIEAADTDPYSSDYVAAAVSNMTELSSQGVVLRVGFLMSSTWEPANLTNCSAWASSVGIDPSQVFIDPNYDTLFGVMDPYALNGALGIPWVSILRGSNMQYVYNNNESGQDVHPVTVINQLLAE